MRIHVKHLIVSTTKKYFICNIILMIYFLYKIVFPFFQKHLEIKPILKTIGLSLTLFCLFFPFYP